MFYRLFLCCFDQNGSRLLQNQFYFDILWKEVKKEKINKLKLIVILVIIKKLQSLLVCVKFAAAGQFRLVNDVYVLVIVCLLTINH